MQTWLQIGLRIFLVEPDFSGCNQIQQVQVPTVKLKIPKITQDCARTGLITRRTGSPTDSYAIFFLVSEVFNAIPKPSNQFLYFTTHT